MDIMNLPNSTAEREAKRNEMIEAVKVYRAIMKDESSSRDEIKEACNKALKKAAELIDLQTETINALIFAGQMLADAVSGKTQPPQA